MNVTNEDYPKRVLRELDELRKWAELTDVVLEVEGRSFPCHRAVLASCSPYFRTMFTSGFAEAKHERISIQDVSEVAMATILDYAYSGCLKTVPDQVQAVMSAARLLQVGFVGCKAAEYMKDLLNVSNCVDVLMYADMLGNLALLESSRRYIASRFNQVVLQPSFLQLPLPLLQSLLERDDLMTTWTWSSKSEEDVVQAALRWLDFDKERLQHLPILCSSFRRPFVSRRLRMELESKTKSPATDCKLVYSNSTVERLGQTRSKMQIFLNNDYFGTTYLQSAPCYDPSSRKLYKMNLPDVSKYSIIVTPDNELYLAGHTKGVRNGVKIATQKAFYQYNHLLNTWESRCEMISPRKRCSLVYLKEYIYAIGGDSKHTAERYNPSCDEWTFIPPIPTPILNPSAVSTDDSIYVISANHCYCFSTTENTWRNIADRLPTPLHEQVVKYEGLMFRLCCNFVSSSVQIYSPEDGTWKSSENGKSFPCHYAMLMVYKRSYGRQLYLITVRSKADPEDDPWDSPGRKWPRIELYEYQKGCDSWSKEDSKDKMVPPISQWLEARRWTECLAARMIPTSLGDGSSYEDEQEGSDYMYGEESDISLSDSDFSDTDSEEDLSDQESIDDDNDDKDVENGRDDGDT